MAFSKNSYEEDSMFNLQCCKLSGSIKYSFCFQTIQPIYY